MTVVEIGPATVRGPGHVDTELAAAAVEFVDDRLALVGDRPVAVDELWADVLASVSVEGDHLTIVHPTWWTARSIDMVCRAARRVVADVSVVSRSAALHTAVPSATVVEIGPELVVVTSAGGLIRAVPRLDGTAVVTAVADEIGSGATVVIDAPAAVDAALAVAVRSELRARGIAVSAADHRALWRAAAALSTPSPADPAPVAGRAAARRTVAVLSGLALSVAAVCAALITGAPQLAGGVPMTLLVEGRIGLMVPATWRVERVTAGPGSARIQVIDPEDQHAVIHITQSPVTAGVTLARAAEVLRRALEQHPPGVFVDFDPADQRPAVTYREIRPGHDIRWTVLLDGAVQIGIGCQSAPDRADQSRYACDEAVRSAHALW